MVKLRLAKQGRKKLPIYKLVAADSRSRRDGRFIESLGQYRPTNEPGNKLECNEDRVMYWLRTGAQPTDTVRSLLSAKGILLKLHLEKKKVDPARAEEIFNTWKAQKEASLQNRTVKQRESAKKRKKAEEDAAAKAAAEATQAAAPAEVPATEAPAAEAKTEAPVVEAKTEAPAAE